MPLPRLGYKKAVTSIWNTCFPCVPEPSLWRKQAAMLWVALWRPMWQRADISSDSRAPDVHEVPDGTPPSSWTLRWLSPREHTQPCGRPWIGDTQLSCAQILTHRNWEIINVCCLKLLRVEVICYAAIESTWYTSWVILGNIFVFFFYLKTYLNTF